MTIFRQGKAKSSKMRSFEHGCSYVAKPMDGRERFEHGCSYIAKPMDGRERVTRSKCAFEAV